jgi:hypothetical protein
MAPRYALASLHGGPLDGDLVETPLNRWRMPVDVIGLPVPVLDEQSEMFWWDTANYFAAPLPPRWRHGDPWPFAYARTLPGYPTYSKDVSDARSIGPSEST